MAESSQLSLPDRTTSTSNEESERVRLPGFGLPVEFLPEWNKHKSLNRFPHAIADYVASEGVTVRERRMLAFIDNITDKPNWERKVFDERVVSKWKEEGSVYNDDIDDVLLSEPMFNYCIAELREKVKAFEASGLVAVMNVDATIVKSDSKITDELRRKLIESVKCLEDVPEKNKDWHPGSDNQVLDLLHPSLFPLVYGLSRVLPTGAVPMFDCAAYTGKGEPCSASVEGDHTLGSSWGNSSRIKAWGHYQWLPSNVNFTQDGGVKIKSYINNLHPETHAALYQVLEQFVEHAIPLWNEALSWFNCRTRIAIEGSSDEDYKIPEGVKYVRPPPEEGETQEELSESDLEYDDHYRDWKIANRVLIQPEPKEFVPFAQPVADEPSLARPVNLRETFAASGLQVIFKLANIHLTPENPEYKGGSWHVEGALNEHICASALYYYDEENLTESHLAFRQSVDVEEMVMKPMQHEYSSLEEFYGIQNEEAAIQELGKILTRQGRFIAFPNVLQHCVQPFKLADHTKPGHRKLLAMFLVDPHIPILSTANVPPQRRDWWAEEVRKVERFEALPREMFDRIIDEVDEFPISWDEAVEIRAKLMGERGGMTEKINEHMEGDTFSFCEH